MRASYEPRKSGGWRFAIFLASDRSARRSRQVRQKGPALPAGPEEAATKKSFLHLVIGHAAFHFALCPSSPTTWISFLVSSYMGLNGFTVTSCSSPHDLSVHPDCLRSQSR